MQYKYRKYVTIDGHGYDVRATSRKELTGKIEKLKKGVKLKKSDYTVKTWSEYCLDTYKVNVSDQTLTGYRSKLSSNVYPAIGSLKITEVTPLECQEVLNAMQGKAQDTIKKVHELLYFIFDKARINHYILYNPAADITLPRGGKSSHRDITDSERTAILAVIDQNPDRYGYFLWMLFCGCRPSEAARIRTCDIDRDNRLLHIRGTKTAAADRYVPIPQYVMDRIPKKDPYELLYVNTRGGALSEGNRRHLWTAFRRDLNLHLGCKTYRNKLLPPYPVAPDLTPYCLRHTYASDLAKAHLDIRLTQKLMGHSSIKITADIYTHIDKRTIIDTAPVIDNYVNHKIQKQNQNSAKNSASNLQPIENTKF